MPTTESKTLLTSAEASRYLGVSRRWLSRAVEERRIRHIKDGEHKQSRVYFRRDDLDAWIESHTVEPRG